MLAAWILLILAVIAALAFGSRAVAPARIVEVLLHPDATPESSAVVGLRVPRTVAGIVAGAALGLAGALMQCLARNPLADPGILGVNAGAGLAVVSAVAITGASSHSRTLLFSFIGAAIAVVGVQLLAGKDNDHGSPVRLALAGVAVSAALSALTQAIILGNAQAFDEFRFWVSGSLEGRGFDVVAMAAPAALLGLVLAIVISPGLDALSLGSDAAVGLGVRVGTTRVISLAAVALLCASATAIAGPLSFVGLAVPYVARKLVGDDLRWTAALAVPLGAAWLLFSDVIARVIVAPEEVPVGVIAALAGAPVFVALVRGAEPGARRRKRRLLSGVGS